ncbi:MAG: hypothetical protein IPP49_18925 [Saprospiraceae bacterium]|nr:hypothetical protein [Saprospiraceae bacterium]
MKNICTVAVMNCQDPLSILYCSKGRMHISGTVNSDDLSIGMSYIPSGIYIILMDSQGGDGTASG